MVSAPVRGTGGREFESHHSDSHVSDHVGIRNVAQSGRARERRKAPEIQPVRMSYFDWVPEVAGSNPAVSTAHGAVAVKSPHHFYGV